ncbi:hypothetical protein JOF57_005106 [Mycolicibacterium lutetiense]|uniref:Uncharacterized protein n=1 Tax=Mycolicibacterium lutetiense TaxID=1641992 RepID=A0ABS5A0E4_9MYCO|nr:hypothetical protein [Mycolicibacterium lutetiense]
MWAQADHADLGLIPDSDHSEDLRPKKNDDPRAATPRPSKPTLNRK